MSYHTVGCCGVRAALEEPSMRPQRARLTVGLDSRRLVLAAPRVHGRAQNAHSATRAYTHVPGACGESLVEESPWCRAGPRALVRAGAQWRSSFVRPITWDLVRRPRLPRSYAWHGHLRRPPRQPPSMLGLMRSGRRSGCPLCSKRGESRASPMPARACSAQPRPHSPNNTDHAPLPAPPHRRCGPWTHLRARVCDRAVSSWPTAPTRGCFGGMWTQ